MAGPSRPSQAERGLPITETPGLANESEWSTVLAMLGLVFVLVATGSILFASLFLDGYHSDDLAHDLTLLALACAALAFALRK